MGCVAFFGHEVEFFFPGSEAKYSLCLISHSLIMVLSFYPRLGFFGEWVLQAEGEANAKPIPNILPFSTYQHVD